MYFTCQTLPPEIYLPPNYHCLQIRRGQSTVRADRVWMGKDGGKKNIDQVVLAAYS